MKKLLLILVAVAFVQFAKAQCTELFISEYNEGSVNNKAIEIYNPTNATVSLTGYTINRYSNGSPNISETMPLTGTIAAYDVVVITNGQTDSLWVAGTPGYWSYGVSPTLYALGDLHSTGIYGPTDPFYFNGDDAITLEKNTVIVDIFGKIGQDPGTGWEVIGASTKYWSVDHSLIRKSTVKQGVTANPTLFTPSIEYDSLPKNNWTNLGIHSCDCNPNAVNEISKVDNFFLFPNPVTNNNFTVKATDFISNVQVYDLLGNNVFNQKANGNRGDMNVELGNVSKGLYFVKLTLQNNQVITKKINVN